MKINPSTLRQAAKKFNLELSELKPLGGMEGMALAYKRGDSSYVLKVSPVDKNNPDQVAAVEEKLKFINYLAENGVRVAKPIPSPGGNLLEEIITNDVKYIITAGTKAQGEHRNLHNPQDFSPSLFKTWGKTIGQMHRVARSYPSWRKYDQDGIPLSKITDWKGEFDHFKNWCQFDDVREKWIELGNEIEMMPVDRDVFGLIHNDLHPWNFLVNKNNEITAIDFDVCAFHFFIKDIAIGLFFANWLGNPGKGLSKDQYLTVFLQNFLEGYSQEFNLEEDWNQKIPIFLKHHQILLFIVFSDEWKSPNKWEANTLQKWKRQILNDIPVVKVLF
jgi:Ser/Thr protein kinase RdoA (MazF antagonist)